MTTTYPTLEQFVDGQWLTGTGDAEPVINPATGEPLTDLHHAGQAQIEAALDAVSRSASAWRRTHPAERAAILHRAADLLRARADGISVTLTLEQGKPLREARAEVLVAADILDWYAEEGRRAYGRVIPGAPGERLMVVPEPIGPVAAFIPWNFPLTSGVRKLGGALAAGCTIVLRASSETPGSVMELFRALHDAGLPAGVANLLLGSATRISGTLLTSPIIRKLTLTGSTPVGRSLSHLAVDRDIVTTMELGGNAPVIVTGNVDAKAVAQALSSAKFRNAGQVCNVPARFFVHRSVYARIVDEIAQIAGSLQVGSGLDPRTEMGPLVSDRRVEAMVKLHADAVARGASTVSGGSALIGPGSFFEPTVLADVPDDAEVVADEAFGPIVPLAPYDDLDEAITRANASEYGLASFAFTDSLSEATHIADNLQAGMVAINTVVVSRVETPFGGIKASGHGRESGIEGLEGYLNRKTVLQAPPLELS